MIPDTEFMHVTIALILLKIKMKHFFLLFMAVFLINVHSFCKIQKRQKKCADVNMPRRKCLRQDSNEFI